MIHHVMGVDGYYPYLLALWLLPLAGAIANFAFGPQLKRLAGPLGCAVIGAAFAATLLSWQSGTQNGGGSAGAVGAHQALFSWIPGFDFGLLLDPLSLLWALIITGVGFLIHLYSMGYMDADNAYARFFAYMNLFVFAMLTLVLSDNFVGLLVGWGLVGLASYFLIGFWFFKPSAVAAARNAFVINVVGDIGIMHAIFMICASVRSTAIGHAFDGYYGWHYPPPFLFAASLLALLALVPATLVWLAATLPQDSPAHEVLLHLARVGTDLKLGLLPALYDDRGYAVYTIEPRLHFISRHLPQLGLWRLVGGQAVTQDGKCREGKAMSFDPGGGWKRSLHSRQLRINSLQGLQHVHVPVEEQVNFRRAPAGDRAHLLQTRDTVDRFLQGTRHRYHHLVNRHDSVVDSNHDAREISGGKDRYRNRECQVYSGQGQNAGQKNDGFGIADKPGRGRSGTAPTGRCSRTWPGRPCSSSPQRSGSTRSGRRRSATGDA